MYNKEPQMVMTSFTVLKPSGHNFSLIVFQQDEIKQTLAKLFQSALHNESNVPMNDSKKIGDDLAEMIVTKLCWPNKKAGKKAKSKEKTEEAKETKSTSSKKKATAKKDSTADKKTSVKKSVVAKKETTTKKTASSKSSSVKKVADKKVPAKSSAKSKKATDNDKTVVDTKKRGRTTKK